VRLKPHRIAALGLARTFQNIRLFAGLTVLENVMVAAAREAPTSLLQIILATAHQRQAEARIRETAMAALETVGLAHRANDAAK
ncbi:ABC transporter ATP-binding protein, partial [Enterococcus faecium]